MSSTNPPLIFPMAHYVGASYDPTDDTTNYDLRGGWKIAHLTQAERDVWGFAHGVPDLLEQGIPWTRAALMEAAQPVVGDTVDRIVTILLGRDVLIEVTPGTPEAIEFAKEVRLVPLQLGLGNTREEPWIWRIGPGTPLVGVTNTVYHMWEWSHLYRSLWDSCQSLAKIRQNREDSLLTEEDLDPEAILTSVLKAAHGLFSTSCAYFDVPFEWGTP